MIVRDRGLPWIFTGVQRGAGISPFRDGRVELANVVRRRVAERTPQSACLGTDYERLDTRLGAAEARRRRVLDGRRSPATFIYRRSTWLIRVWYPRPCGLNHPSTSESTRMVIVSFFGGQGTSGWAKISSSSSGMSV